jgi:hypothetical protein
MPTKGSEWQTIPHTGGMVRNVNNGKIMHQQHFMIHREAQQFAASQKKTDPSELFRNGARRSATREERPQPPTIMLRCFDVVGGNPGAAGGAPRSCFVCDMLLAPSPHVSTPCIPQ